jgi:hypothetical protein
LNAVEREVRFHVGRGAKSEKQVRKGGAKPIQDKVPRIARLMALAIHFDKLIREGKVKDYAEIARRGRVTRAHVTHMMMLLNLSPGIQDRLLSGNIADIPERSLRKLARVADWPRQDVALSRWPM